MSTSRQPVPIDPDLAARALRRALAAGPAVVPHRHAEPPGEVSHRAKVEFLERANEAARAVSAEIAQVSVTFDEWVQEVAILETASGRWVEEEREAAAGVVLLLDAVPAPAGPTPVVLGPGSGMTGVLIHEACGHALESDFVMKGNSIYAGKLGQKVASELVTAIDDATLEGEMGAVPVDDEGVDGTRTVLIRNGILESYLCDRIGAAALGIQPTGNGRRESFHYPPLPRMTTTFVAPGTSDPAGLLAGIRRGLCVARMGGGAGDLSGAGFTFAVDEGWLIENGRITRPVKGATLTGTGWDVLMGIEVVGRDFALDPGGGRCDKMQLVPVSTGLPSLRVRGMVVGGTEARDPS